MVISHEVVQMARRLLNVDLIPARLGDGNGNVYDLNNIGNYYLRKLEADGGLSQPFSLPVNPLASIPPKDGLAVSIGYDLRGIQCIWQADVIGMQASNVNPLILNPLDTAVYGKLSQSSIATLYCQRHGDTATYPFTVVVFPAPLVIDGIANFFAGGAIDLSSFVPAAGLHCFATVFVKDDMTLEAFASTPTNLNDPLTVDVDIQECITQAAATSVIVWAWELRDTDTALSPDPARNVDMRQLNNTAVTGTGGGTVDSVVAGDGIAVDATDPANPIVSNDGVITIVAGTNITVDATDPQNPIVSASGGGGGGTVDSVVAGTGIDVDATDPANPEVSIDSTVVTLTGTQTLTNKTINSSSIGVTTAASGYFSALRLLIGGFYGIFTHANSADRTYTFPNYNGTMATLAGSETLTNKTLTAPTINNGYMDGTNLGSVTPPFGIMSNLEITGLLDVDAGDLNLPFGSTAPATAAGRTRFNTTYGGLYTYDGSRIRGINPLGYLPYAEPIGNPANATFGVSSNIAANGGTFLLPVFIPATMLLYSVSVFNRDTATARTWGWDLYLDTYNTSNSVDRVASSNGNDTFTPSAISTRTLAATSSPVILAPGLYWLAIQNRHATNTFAFAGEVSPASASWTANKRTKFKTTTNPNGSTLDIVAATWTETTSFYAARLNGSSANSGASYFTP